ncbi:hypothetical protein GCM10027169_15920 [Gordonia jinhuaensis]|uniref:Uncharacterized protein n=1 Tax=Gordonia jinhuaensis TaxID=1517702 RepID=A0A916X0L6_9ACTN|nr:hypothetical protein GCM10011489_39880 [Gordonia jinhuaensis]
MCWKHYQRRRRRGLPLPPKQRYGSFVAEALELHEQAKAAYEDRRDAWAIGYGTERDLYASEVEPKPLYSDALKSTSREWRARETDSNAS